MLKFPVGHLFDEQKSYNFLKNLLHPNGFGCPNGHELPPNQAPHKHQKREAVVNFRCRTCRKIFNIFTDTSWSGSSYPCSTIILILRGFAQGTPTLHLSKELNIDYKTLLERRHQFQENAYDNRILDELTDDDVETDEMFQNAGEKGIPHLDPEDPPRVRANKKVGIGTMDGDRPPVFSAVGRDTGEIRLEVCDSTKQSIIQPEVEKKQKRNLISIQMDPQHITRYQLQDEDMQQ